jgi:hypothetical protein
MSHSPRRLDVSINKGVYNIGELVLTSRTSNFEAPGYNRSNSVLYQPMCFPASELTLGSRVDGVPNHVYS